ncbi:unnamed protein product [Durusdinium trenchii]|uniref:Pyridoxamine 5'-phosphate oxidase Alr4036 family FMN-binding domain-containing protein n=1 Tax=Durusdinium trenchii TaxID=1381693 RepID=A0ABP0L1L3_9DINO
MLRASGRAGITGWKSVCSSAASQREAKRKQLQLAMVDPATLAPTVRTVVFRGFARLETESTDEQESCIMVLISDERAQKVRHIQEGFPNSRVEICWLDEAGVQFRIAGQALVACADTADEELQQLRRKVWQRLKPSTRQTFSWPQPGASLRAEVKALKADVLATDAGEIDLQVGSSFGVENDIRYDAHRLALATHEGP